MSIPALLLVKKALPDTPVYYALEEPFSGLGELLPGVDGVMVIPSKMTIKDYQLWRKEVKSKHISTIIDLHSGPKSALLTRLSGCPIRVGYKTKNRNWAYTHLNDNRKSGQLPLHSVVNQVSLLENIGIHTDPQEIPGYQLKTSVDTLPHPPGIDSADKKTSPQVVIHVGAGNRFRYWGDSHYVLLIKGLIKKGISCHLIGFGKEESQRARLWNEMAPSQIHDWVGKCTLLETLALINQSNCYFGPDSGPLHLASLTATPIVGLYGPNIPDISGPWRKKNVTILEEPLSCRPCSQRECQYDTIRCMEVIDAQKALDSVLGYFIN